MTFTDDQIRALPGAAVYDAGHARIGTVGQVWADTTGQPSWVSVDTGLFGSNETLLPLVGAQIHQGQLYTPYDKARVTNAPNLDVSAEEPLDADGLRALFDHYRLVLDRGAGTSPTDQPPAPPTGADLGAADDGAAMTRSEERLTVGTEREQTGRVRLRKYVVTEYVTTTVPVRHEEVRLERVPVNDDTDLGDATPPGDEIGDDEHEIVLHAERPVVSTETVPVERVRLGKQTITGQQTVSGEVRKERIDVETSDAPSTEAR